MRIYNADGSYRENITDFEFGWNLSEFEEEKVILINPNIKIHTGNDEHNGIEALPCDLALNIQQHDDESQRKLTQLISPYSIESKTLLGVLNYKEWKQHIAQEVLPKIKSNSDLSNQIKFIINEQNVTDVDREIQKEIQQYHETKEENMMSLMMELVLTDINCEIQDLTGGCSPKNCPSCISPTKPSDSNNYLQPPGYCDSFVSNISPILDKSLENISFNTREIHTQIQEIKRSFIEVEERVNELIRDSQRFERSLRETFFLDKLIALLDCDLENIREENGPFRLFSRNKSKLLRNFIV